MGLFSKIKKAFKKITGAVKKVVKKVVKGVKKVVKKIGSSKILKSLATAAAVVVTGGAAIGAFTGGAGLAGATKLGQFGNWAMNASKTVSSGSLFGKAAGKKFLPKILTQTGNFLTKTAAKPFTSLGSSVGNIARGVTDFTGLTDASTKELAKETPKTGFWKSGVGEVVKTVGTNVATQVATGAAMQYIQGDPEQEGSMARAAYEGSTDMDPLRIYASEQGINTDSIYQHMLYGNQDPSTLYGNELYRQQTIGVA